MATNKKTETKPTIEDYWWLQTTKNPDGSKNETITVISNIYCLCDFKGIQLNDFEESINIKPGSLFKILNDTEATWNDDTTPISKQELPIIGDNVVEKASKYFFVSEETLREVPFSPDFYYYTFGQPTSLNVKEANEQNMKLILFIEKITLDCRNYTFNITQFEDGDANHFGAKYEITYINNPAYKFKIQKDQSGSIVILIGSTMVDKLVFANNDIIYPMASRMEDVLHQAAVRDAQCKKVTRIPTNVFNVMDSFLAGEPIKEEKAPEPSKGWRMPEGFNETKFEAPKTVQMPTSANVESAITEYAENKVVDKESEKTDTPDEEETVEEKSDDPKSVG